MKRQSLLDSLRTETRENQKNPHLKMVFLRTISLAFSSH